MNKYQLILNEINELIHDLESEQNKAWEVSTEEYSDYYLQGLEYQNEHLDHIKKMIEMIIRDENINEALSSKVSVSEGQLRLL